MKMTKKELAQYRSICAEILELKKSINDNTMHDTVRGSDSEFPFLSHPMQVTGVRATEDNQKTLVAVRKLEMKKREIENFIDNIEDSLTRRIFRLRFIEGMNWKQISVQIGGGNTDISLRQMMCRYLAKLA